MLFSQPDLAAAMSAKFECAWQRLRAAPQVEIDFGDGHVIHRTLHGNVLTWICDPDGRVLDAVPGVCTPESYFARIEDARWLLPYLAQKPAAERDAAFRDYHARQAARLAASKPPLVIAHTGPIEQFFSKRAIEKPIEYLLAEPGAEGVLAERFRQRPIDYPLTQPAAEGPLERERARVDGDALVADTRLNATVRRKAISTVLAETGQRSPEDLTKRAYREVLGVDLDDPYLGLGEVLFRTYPFEK